MEIKLVKKVLNVADMTCASCEMRIERLLSKIEGVSKVKASFASSTVTVIYDLNRVKIKAIIDAINKSDYKVITAPNTAASKHAPAKADREKFSVNKLVGIAIIVLALYYIFKNTNIFNNIPEIDQSMGYGILFVVGLITSLHCIAMCGGINLSQCVSYKFDAGAQNARFSKLRPSLLYNAGRVISYTVVGGIVGALGSAISFTGTAKGIVAVISGIFMVIMGVNMLNIFPWLRKFNPRMPKIFGNKLHGNEGKNGPLYVGLLNGLMPCGPLQAMQIYALGTGSVLAGAAAMFFFSLGTVPLMFGFGALSSILSGKFTKKMMKFSAILVIVLGIVMMNRGLNQSGLGFTGVVSAASDVTAASNIAQIENGVQVINTKLGSNSYPSFIVQAGIPVKWTMTAAAGDLNGCNGSLTIPKYNITKKLVAGDNLIEFTPKETGNITYTCWMGMISAGIKVIDDISKISADDANKFAASGSQGSGSGAGGCCAGGAQATKFAGGKIPTDEIQIATVINGIQTVTVTVNDQGYSPAVVVLQKGVRSKITFKPEQLNSCNYLIAFSKYLPTMNLKTLTETNIFTPDSDFTFQCGMGMLHAYVKVVDDINNIDTESIKKDVANFKPAAGGGCCG